MAKKSADKKNRADSSEPAPRGKKTASHGPIRAISRFLGSLTLAVVLLVSLVAVLAGATLLESSSGRVYAQWYVYHSQWFVALLALLAVNVLMAMAVRFPWKRRQAGFLVTHIGLLVLLAGAIHSYLASVDGQLTFAEGETADTIVLSDRSQLTTSWRQGGAETALDFAFQPGPTAWPAGKTLDLGESDEVRVKVLRFYSHARRELSWVEDPSGRSGPAVQFALLGSKGTQVAGRWLSAGKSGGQTVVGPARFALCEVPLGSMLDDLLSPPTENLGSGGLLSVYYKNHLKQVSVDENTGKRFAIGDDGTEVEIAEYLPNARPGAGGKFNSDGGKPLNPLLELRVHLGDGKQPLRQIAFAKVPFLNLDGIHGRSCPVKFLYHHPAVSAQPGTEFLQTPDGKLYCRIGSKNGYQSRGEVHEGDRIEAFADFKVSLLRHVRHARQKVEFRPAEPTPAETQPPPAALFEVAVAGDTHQMWLVRGSRQYGSERIETAKGPVLVAFGYARRALGFSLKLVDFTRGLNPGRMGDASYASDVQLRDPSLGLTLKQTISMNEPLTHGKFTFYQSGFNRAADGRDVSVLSVARDPGRFLKYSGSLMLCVGTFMVFYLKGRLSFSSWNSGSVQ